MCGQWLVVRSGRTRSPARSSLGRDSSPGPGPLPVSHLAAASLLRSAGPASPSLCSWGPSSGPGPATARPRSLGRPPPPSRGSFAAAPPVLSPLSEPPAPGAPADLATGVPANPFAAEPPVPASEVKSPGAQERGCRAFLRAAPTYQEVGPARRCPSAPGGRRAGALHVDALSPHGITRPGQHRETRYPDGGGGATPTCLAR